MDIIGIYSLLFEKSMGLYRSSRYPSLYAATMGAGISKAGKIERFILRIKPDVVINAGLAGILEHHRQVKTGSRLSVNKVIDRENGSRYRGGPGRNQIISVRQPVFSPQKKREHFLQYGANVCDMEAAPLLAILERCAKKFPLPPALIFCKVAGDTPQHRSLFQKEHIIRGWHRKNSLQRLIPLLHLSIGPFTLLRLLSIKKKALTALYWHIQCLVHLLIKKQALTKGIDSVFYAAQHSKTTGQKSKKATE